jgi:hypothetical protein
MTARKQAWRLGFRRTGATDSRSWFPCESWPVAFTQGTLELLGDLQPVINIVILQGAGYKPRGDLIL